MEVEEGKEEESLTQQQQLHLSRHLPLIVPQLPLDAPAALNSWIIFSALLTIAPETHNFGESHCLGAAGVDGRTNSNGSSDEEWVGADGV